MDEFQAFDELDEFASDEFGSDDFEDMEDFSAGSFEDSFDGEADEFFKVFKKIGRKLKKFKPFRKLAAIAARAAGGMFGGPLGAKLAGRLTQTFLKEDGEAFYGDDFDEEDFDGFGLDGLDDFDLEDEEDESAIAEDDARPLGLDLLDDGLSEELAAQAMKTSSPAEAASLVGGITIHITSNTPMAVKRITPVLIKGSTRLAHLLRRRRSTRMLVGTIPTIQRRAVKSLVRKAKAGKPITSSHARRALSASTYRTLSSRRNIAKGLANNRVKRLRASRIMRKHNKKVRVRR